MKGGGGGLIIFNVKNLLGGLSSWGENECKVTSEHTYPPNNASCEAQKIIRNMKEKNLVPDQRLIILPTGL